MGMFNAGFRHAAVIERDPDACENFRENQRRHLQSIREWPLFQGSVEEFDYATLSDIMVVSGGPPCQPFSLGGKHRGHLDHRDMWPQAVRAVRELQPKAFIFENVKGLMRQTFADYFEYIFLQLTHPRIERRKTETWQEHRVRIEKHHTSKKDRPEYNVVPRLLNAADYGVPQRRERVFFVGFRSDLGLEWSYPEPLFSEDALFRSQWLTGEYWERHRIPKRQRPTLTTRQLSRLDRLRPALFEGIQRPWQTVRDALSDLPDPEKNTKNEISNHIFVPGARSYLGHTGSPLDEPAKTLKAGDHGVPGGENMLSRLDGSIRYFTVREAARLQTFPDDYAFKGAWTESMRQLGNAVPVLLAETVAKSVVDILHKQRTSSSKKYQ